jgi:hypothetical protein
MSSEATRQRRGEVALLRLVVGVSGILFSEALAAERVVVFAKACELGLEGIATKRRGSFYKSGRSRNWLKTVNPDSVRTRPPAARLRNFRVAPSVFVRAVVARVTTLCRARVRALRAR